MKKLLLGTCIAAAAFWMNDAEAMSSGTCFTKKIDAMDDYVTREIYENIEKPPIDGRKQALSLLPPTNFRLMIGSLMQRS